MLAAVTAPPVPLGRNTRAAGSVRRTNLDTSSSPQEAATALPALLGRNTRATGSACPSSPWGLPEGVLVDVLVDLPTDLKSSPQGVPGLPRDAELGSHPLRFLRSRDHSLSLVSLAEVGMFLQIRQSGKVIIRNFVYFYRCRELVMLLYVLWEAHGCQNSFSPDLLRSIAFGFM